MTHHIVFARESGSVGKLNKKDIFKLLFFFLLFIQMQFLNDDKKK